MDNGIDFTEKRNVDVIYELTIRLHELGIKSASDAHCRCIEILDDDFCTSCSVHKDACECQRHYDYDNDYDNDRAYDEWKDDQMEKDKT